MGWRESGYAAILGLLLHGVAAPAWSQAPVVSVLNTHPAPDANLTGRDSFYLQYRIETPEKVRVGIEAYSRGAKLAVGNSGQNHFEPGTHTGAAFLFVSQKEPVQVDEIRLPIWRESTHWQQPPDWVASVPVALLHLPSSPRSQAPLPDWVNAWNKDREMRRQAAVQAAQANAAASESWVENLLLRGFLIVIIFVLPLAALALPIWAAWTWERPFRTHALIACAIFVVKVGTVMFDVARDPTSHNLWPLEMMMWTVPLLAYLGGVWLWRRSALRRAASARA